VASALLLFFKLLEKLLCRAALVGKVFLAAYLNIASYLWVLQLEIVVAASN
jgi:hypothetical protein